MKVWILVLLHSISINSEAPLVVRDTLAVFRAETACVSFANEQNAAHAAGESGALVCEPQKILPCGEASCVETEHHARDKIEAEILKGRPVLACSRDVVKP